MVRERLVVACGDRARAEAAMRRLTEGGFPSRQLALIASGARGARVLRGQYPGGRARITAAGSLLGGLVGLAAVGALSPPPALGGMAAAGVLAAALLGALLGRVRGARRAPAPWRWLPPGSYLVVARGDAHQIDRANAILAESLGPESCGRAPVGTPPAQRAMPVASSERPLPGVSATRPPTGPGAQPAGGGTSTIVSGGDYAAFSPREWQRLLFLRWLYRQGRLHDWIEHNDRS